MSDAKHKSAQKVVKTFLRLLKLKSAAKKCPKTLAVLLNLSLAFFHFYEKKIFFDKTKKNPFDFLWFISGSADIKVSASLFAVHLHYWMCSRSHNCARIQFPRPRISRQAEYIKEHYNETFWRLKIGFCNFMQSMFVRA